MHALHACTSTFCGCCDALTAAAACLASGGQIFKLCKLPGDNTVASVAWSQTGTHLSVGSDGGGVQIYDVNQNRM